MNSDYESAKKLVQEFVREKLNGIITNWKHFDTKELSGSDRFGCPGRWFDCDDTNLMRAVYILLWGRECPDLTMENLGTGKRYRGDTMNTFHTMFGREIPDRPGFYFGLERYDPPESLREEVRKFSKKCSQIGNYIVLPNSEYDGKTLNTFRGCNEWHDFFDRFLMALQEFLCGNDHTDKTFRRLMENNQYFFHCYQGQSGFLQFADRFFLKDFLDPEGNAREIYSMNFHWRAPEKREKYLSDAAEYLQNVNVIIERRSDLLLQALAEILKN